jgi:hypothetical protein
MKYDEVYDTYCGPPLIKATLNGSDILPQITELYGTSKNWKKTLYTIEDLQEILKREVIGSIIYLEFINKYGRTDWTRMYPKNDKEVFNNLMFLPFNQNKF